MPKSEISGAQARRAKLAMGPAALRDGGCERRTAVSASQLKRIGQLRIYISYDSHIVVAERIRLESDHKSRAQLRIERGWR